MRSPSGELSFLKLFTTLAVIPTLLAIVYYGLIASDMYVSETQFSIYSNEPTASPIGIEGLSQLASGNIRNTPLEQLLTVYEYIKSYDLLKELDKEINLKEIYSDSDIDSFSRLSETPSNKEFLNHYHNMIEVEINREASIIRLGAKAFKKEDALKIAEGITKLTEEFINKMLNRVKKDSLIEAEEFILKAENKIKANQTALTQFRINNGTLDPSKELEAKLELIRSLEVKKAELIIEKSQKKSLLSTTSIPISSIKTKIKNIDELIRQTKGEILGFSSKQGDILREYEMLRLDEEFAKEEYKLALLNLEQTIKELTSKNKYLVEILKPTTPDVATEPNRIMKIVTVFIASIIFFGILGLMISGVRDHMI